MGRAISAAIFSRSAKRPDPRVLEIILDPRDVFRFLGVCRATRLFRLVLICVPPSDWNSTLSRGTAPSLEIENFLLSLESRAFVEGFEK
jgi:hypothetical protein